MTSRIQKSIANAKVNSVFYILSAILAFFSRKIFLENLGTEFLGLSGTLGDILSLMNITELGIGTAIGVSLYKPVFAEDKKTINDIISVFGYLYSRVGTIIGCGGLLVSLFFPLIFHKADISLFIVYLMFYSMIYSSLIGYFVNYRQILLSASQREYVVSWRYNIANMLKVICQIGVSFLPYNYIWWILLQVVASTVYTIILNRTIDRYFPWLKPSIKEGKQKFKEYIHLWKTTKQVFVLKISHLVNIGTINIFIGIFASLSSVAFYGNYKMLMAKVTGFVDSVFTGMGASVGNLIAEGDKEKTMNLFFELLSIRYFLASLCSISLYFIVPRFVYIWLGPEYVLSTLILVLMSIDIFIQQARLTVDNFRAGFGLYQDVWAPVTEVIICCISASILGYYFKLSGIIAGYVIGEILIRMIWRPYYLFKKGFNCSVLKYYWPKFTGYITIGLLILILISFVNEHLGKFLHSETWLGVISYSIVIGGSVFLTLLSSYWIFDTHFRRFVNHMVQYYRTNKK